jgi:hypothetical protein
MHLASVWGRRHRRGLSGLAAVSRVPTSGPPGLASAHRIENPEQEHSPDRNQYREEQGRRPECESDDQQHDRQATERDSEPRRPHQALGHESSVPAETSLPVGTGLAMGPPSSGASSDYPMAMARHAWPDARGSTGGYRNESENARIGRRSEGEVSSREPI